MSSGDPVLVLGAGLAGMSASRHLGSRPHVLLEALPHAGGHATTSEEDGYRFDKTGHLLHLRDPEIGAWVRSLIGHDCVEIQRNSRVFSHGVYTRYPYQANTYGLPPAVAHECLLGYLQARENVDAVPAPRDFEAFCQKYFGPGFSKHFMIPYNERLWGTHPRNITAEWCSRFVPIPKLDDVIAGAVGLNDRELGYNTHFIYPRLGIGALIDAMVQALPQAPRFGTRPTQIDAAARRAILSDGTEVQYDALISSAPLDRLLDTIVDAPPHVRQARAKLRCTSLYYLDVALDVPCGIDMHWVYVPEERFVAYRVGCYSNFSSAMAPAGKANLYVELASREPPDRATLEPKVIEQLIEMRIIQRPSDVRFMRLRFIEHAYVIFDHNYYEALEAISPFLDEHRIVSTGRYGGWNYSSMEDALRFGRDAAKKVLSW